MQMDPQIPAKRSERMILLKKEDLPNSRFGHPNRSQVKIKESEKKKYKYLGIARELKKLWNMRVTVIPIFSLTNMINLVYNFLFGIKQLILFCILV